MSFYRVLGCTISLFLAERLNRVTNKADADRIIRRWAEILNKHMGEVQKQSAR